MGRALCLCAFRACACVARRLCVRLLVCGIVRGAVGMWRRRGRGRRVREERRTGWEFYSGRKRVKRKRRDVKGQRDGMFKEQARLPCCERRPRRRDGRRRTEACREAGWSGDVDAAVRDPTRANCRTRRPIVSLRRAEDEFQRSFSCDSVSSGSSGCVELSHFPAKSPGANVHRRTTAAALRALQFVIVHRVHSEQQDPLCGSARHQLRVGQCAGKTRRHPNS